MFTNTSGGGVCMLFLQRKINNSRYVHVWCVFTVY